MHDAMPGLQQGARSRFLNYLQLIWFRRKFVLAVTLAVTVLGVAWLSLQPPVYRSTSSLSIGLPESLDLVSSDSGQPVAPIDEISSEVELLRSRKLATTMVRQLQLQLYPELNPTEGFDAGFPATVVRRLQQGFSDPVPGPESGMEGDSVLPAVVERVLDRLDVERVGNSRVVRVTFSAHDPQLAERVANALPEVYMAARQQARIQTSSSAADFATERFLQLQERLAVSERAEAYYRRTLGLEETEGMVRLNQDLSDLNSRLLIVRGQRDDALAGLDLVEGLAAGEAPSPEALERLGSPELERLLERRAQLDKQVTGMAGEVPERGHADEDIAAANAAVRLELNSLVGALQDEAASASEEVIALESELATLKLKGSTQHRRLLQLQELEKETAINRLRFEAAADRIRQSGIGAELVAPDTELISAATVSNDPLYPGRKRQMVQWVLGGLLLGFLLVLARQMRNPGLLSPEHVHFVLGESTIGVIPEARGEGAPHELVLDAPKSDFSASVAALKITLDLADLDEPTRSVQLVSSTAGEGRASLSVALARFVAGQGHKVLLVSAHLRHSSIEEKVGVSNRAAGLTDLMLEDDPQLVAFLQRDHRSTVQVLSAGTAEYANPDVVFSSQRMRSLVEQMRAEFDFIVFDTPPVMSTAEAIAIGRLVDKTLFVVRWNKTPKAIVAESLKQMRAGGLDIAGVVLQHVNLQRYGKIEFSDFGYLYQQER
jgi:succinoglycan biosynthesis transport protein ExoP